MTAMIALGSIVLILIVLIDTFETMLLPRRVRHQFRFARVFYVYSWAPWAVWPGGFDPISVGTRF